MATTKSKTPADVAAWMLRRLESSDGYLAQDEAAQEIENRFGSKFVKETDTGGLSIDREVLAAFRDLTEKTIVWDKSERAWRKRESHDPDSRQAD